MRSARLNSARDSRPKRSGGASRLQPGSEGVRLALIALLAGSLACASTPAPDPASAPAPSGEAGTQDGEAGAQDPVVADPNAPEPEPTQAQSAPGGGLGRRAESAVEGVIIGTVVGGQVGGGYGAAAGAVLFGIYGLLTGDVPFDSGRGQPHPGGSRTGGDADEALDQEIEDEIERQTDLEREIEEELKRQEDLLAEINKQEELNEQIRHEEMERARRTIEADPLAAPSLPHEREIPESLYEKERRKEEGGTYVYKTLDADRDGRPEIQIVQDAKTGAVVRRAEDSNYDGSLDTHNSYESGELTERTVDTNHDGQPDRWVRYEADRASRVEVDRDFDGKRDGFQIYENGWLAREEHDTNGDGRIDRLVEYGERRRVAEHEDSNHDGRMDVHTYYDEREIPIRVELDTKGDGAIDVWEYYAGTDPSNVVLVRKEEDVTADGNPDIKSYYENGKLTRKEVSDPSLLTQ